MSDDQKFTGGWTFETLEKWVLSLDKQYEQRFVAQEKSIAKAEQAQNQYNVLHNDLMRKAEELAKITVSDKRFEDFKKDYDVRHQLVVDDINELRRIGSRSEGKTEGITASWAIILAVASIVAGYVLHYLK